MPCLLEILDSIGESSICDQYCIVTEGALILFDVTSRQSFEDIENVILPRLRDTRGEDAAPVVIILVGTKVDLEEKRVVAPAEGRSLAERQGWFKYLDTSAKKRENVDECFYGLVRGIRKLREGGEAGGQQQAKKKRCCIM